MKSLIALMFVTSLFSVHAAEPLKCEAKDISISARLQGYSLSNVKFKNKDFSKATSFISYTKSYDMFQSQRFEGILPYPVYHLGSNNGCHYSLALPGGDMRKYKFTGLLVASGYCRNTETELNCTTL